jgi:hypothetical protein
MRPLRHSINVTLDGLKLVSRLELARALVADHLGKPAADFDAAASFVLEKNAELYRRLG